MNMSGPSYYEAYNWVCYLREHEIIDHETYIRLHKLLYSTVASEDEKKGIEIAEILVGTYPRAFNKFIKRTTYDTHICTDYVDIII